jgi:probable rRNA maturation factor
MKSDPHLTFRRKPAHLDCAALEAFAQTLGARVAKRGEFHCLITNDAELQALNLRFRGKDYATDVLSFPSESAEPESARYLGDIAISLQRARAQAKEYGIALDEELRILMLHGVLHLTGLDHETDSGEMARAEMRWRKKLDLRTGLIERAK